MTSPKIKINKKDVATGIAGIGRKTLPQLQELSPKRQLINDLFKSQTEVKKADYHQFLHYKKRKRNQNPLKDLIVIDSKGTSLYRNTGSMASVSTSKVEKGQIMNLNNVDDDKRYQSLGCNSQSP